MYTIASIIVSFVDFQQNNYMHPVCILKYFHPSKADIVCCAHKNSKKADCNNYIRSVLTEVKKEAGGASCT